MKPLKILFWIPNPSELDAARFVYLSWRNGILASGHFFYTLTAEHGDWERRIDEVKPDIFFLTNLSDLERTAEILARIRKKGVFVFQVVMMPFPQRWLEAIRDLDPADIYFGDREYDSMTEFPAITGKPYMLIPSAADRLLHFPTQAVERYRYDVVFLGSRRTQKSEMFLDILIPLTRDKRYRVGLFGPFWTKRDYAMAAAQRLLRQSGLRRTSKWIADKRITVPFDEENALYSSATISLNFHEREPDGSQPHHVLNLRTFKIPACGGFQLCDRVAAMPNYFRENEEIVMASDAREFREKIDYYLAHDEARERIRKQGMLRAHTEHTFHNRVDLLLRLFHGVERTGLQPPPIAAVNALASNQQ